MNKWKIWKTSLEIMDEQKVLIPTGSSPLCVQIQKNTATIWWEVNPNERMVERLVRIIGTGNGIPDESVYLGTVQMLDGSLVWHVYIDPMEYSL